MADKDVVDVGGNGNSVVQAGAARGGRGPGRQKMAVIELSKDRHWTTDGDSNYDYHLVGPALYGIGPYIEDIVPHAKGTQFTTNFKYKLIGECSYDGEVWTAFASDLLPQQTATGGKVGAAHSTRTDYGLHIRFKVGINDAGASERGTLSLTVAIKFWS